MQRLIIVFTLIVFVAAGYLFLQPASEQAVTTDDTPPPVSEQAKRDAQEHISSLTQQAAEQTLAMNEADHFVTGEQLLQLPAKAQSSGDAISMNEADTNSTAVAFAVDRAKIGTNNTAGSSAAALASMDKLRLQELLNNPDQARSEVFYIHSVDGADRQGLWGILHQGLIETFTRGIRIDDRSRLLSVTIPEDADEPLSDQRSSWLGTLLKNKVETTWVYNYEHGLLGQNPDVIHPGQQLIIVRFDEDELINIYNHFIQQH